MEVTLLHILVLVQISKKSKLGSIVESLGELRLLVEDMDPCLPLYQCKYIHTFI